MTDQGPSFLPGQSPVLRRPGDGLGPVVLPGVNDQAPYGMRPGVRHVLPEQIDLDAPPKPEAVQLDESPVQEPQRPAAGEAAQPPVKHTGWTVADKTGKVVFDMPLNPDASKASQAYRVMTALKALDDHAVSPGEKEAAQRALQFGVSLVGTLPVDEVIKAGVHRYDEDVGNDTKLTMQGMRTRNRGGGGAGGPAGPTKADKFQHTLDKELKDRVDAIIKDERGASKYGAISQLDNSISEMEALLSSKNAMGQRVAVQKALLELTGKASRESEQAALTGAAGKFEELRNKLSLWTSDDPQLSSQYINEFKGMLNSQRQYINQQKDLLGKNVAQRAYAESGGYPEEDRQAAYDIAYGALTGRYQGHAAYGGAPSGKAAAPAPTGGGFDPKLLK